MRSLESHWRNFVDVSDGGIGLDYDWYDGRRQKEGSKAARNLGGRSRDAFRELEYRIREIDDC